MEAYTGFAQVYDIFMDNTPYDEWCERICRVLRGFEIKDGLVLDLGCGTGELTERLSAEGYDMIGVDMSEDMLGVAMDKREKHGRDILYLCQDMREFELYGTVAAVVSVCDSLNYILDEEELTQVFRLVNNYLDPGGIFIFDFNTVHKYRTIGESTIAENREEGSFIWENYFDEATGINEYDLTIYSQNEQGLYERFEEQHFQRGYELSQIKQLLAGAGLVFVSATDADTGGEPGETGGRITVIARECGK